MYVLALQDIHFIRSSESTGVGGTGNGRTVCLSMTERYYAGTFFVE